MLDSVIITTKSSIETKLVATRLLKTLYTDPVIICLFGEVGAGKTTFMQGFLEHLSEEFLPSPTYNLEHRYTLLNHYKLQTLVHIDLYRLSADQAQSFWEHVEIDAALCCVEWPTRLEQLPSKRIEVHIEVLANDDRRITIVWQDVPLPSLKQVEQWRQEVALSQNVIKHCNVVAAVALECSQHLAAAGTPVRQQFVQRAGQLHDLLRFIDFKTQHTGIFYTPSASEQQVWQSMIDSYGMGHEQAVEQFLATKGYSELGFGILPHGGKEYSLYTIEQKILYYSDKRVVHDGIVSINERYNDMITRYYNNTETPTMKNWLEELRLLEAELIALGLKPDALSLIRVE